MSTFTTIDEYISGFEGGKQKLLKDIRAIIKKAAPKESKETINYKMPTYRYNGNLIHFAMFTNHLGLYPGVDAIENFAEELKPYKTSKGAIQIPLDRALPEKLITDIVHFNAERLKERQYPSWETKHERWDECQEFMNQIILRNKTPLKREIKWGADVYTYEGKNVIGWGGFKDFFSLWFYNGVFLEDKLKVLVTASEGKTKSLRQWRFTDIKDMDEEKILAYIEESVQTIKDGKEIKPDRSLPKKVEGLFKDALDKDKIFSVAFEKLTPGKKKEYIEYIDEAKQDKTKESRLEKIRPMILEGKGLHDKYKK